ncbi:MAG: EboA domain-containing protein [Thalassotalea sp.]
MNTETLCHHLTEQLNSEEQRWLSDSLALIKTSSDPINDLLNISVIVKRKLTSTITFSIPSATVSLRHCDNAELIRILLLLATFEYHPQLNKKTSLKAYYQAGDSSEKCAFLKGLSLFDAEGEGVNLAVNAGRCNSLDEFSALALNNPYPALFFPVLNFNQTVLKALFLGLEIDAVVNLAKRQNSNLSNMCFSYAVEQALAERIPPASLWLAITFDDLNDENKQLFTEYFRHFYHFDKAHQLLLTTLINADKIPNVLDNKTES